jgi:POT family proton-dependent oligopeptide transporter
VATATSAAATTLDRPPGLDDRAFFGHPRGLALLFIVEMWERFSYYGMRGLLVLYLINRVGWTDGDANRLYGTYTSLVYLTPLIGGYLADRLIGTRRSLVIGGLVIALGHFSLVFENPVNFYLGLALVIIGTGFFKPNVSTMVGQIYREGDPRRDSGFTIFYMGINLGAFLAGIVCGSLAQRLGWSYGFGAAGVGMLAGLIIYMIFRDKYLPGIGVMRPQDRANAPAAAAAKEAVEDSKVNPAHAIAGAAVGAIIAFLAGNTIMGYLFGIIIGAALGITLLGTHGEERKRVIALFIVAFFVVFFWMAFEQAGSSMNIFADRYTDRMVGSFRIPAPWFQSVNAGFILLLAPLFAALWAGLGRRNREPSTALKMAVGLFLLGLGFLFLVVGAHGADACVARVGEEAARSQCNVVSPMWLVLAYLLHTCGELCLSPVGLSYVTKVAPVKFASLLMGVWFLANSAANFVAGQLAAMTDTITKLSTFFSIPVYTSIGAGVLMLLMVPVLKRLTRTVPSA